MMETPVPEGDTIPRQESNSADRSADSETERTAGPSSSSRPVEPRAAPVEPHAEDASTQKPEKQDTASAEIVAHNAADTAVLSASRKRTRRAFVGFAAAAAGAYGLRRYLHNGPLDEMIPGLLHKTYAWNADVSRTVLRDHALAPTYPLDKAESLRINGVFGLRKALQHASYRLQVVGVKDARQSQHYVDDVTAWQYAYDDAASHEDQGHDSKTDPSKASSAKMAPEGMQGKTEEDENHTGRKPRGVEEAGESDSTLPPRTPGLLLRLDDFLPRLKHHELVLQFKCIEGWSQIVQWGGVRMADFLDLFPPEPINGKDPKYLYMETPDGDYYVGYDLDALRHPQALLVTEMMGQPLTQYHGAPLRLYTPTRYGYKQIKRIGLIAYTNDKPDDYWAKLGYDWYAGL